MNFRCLCWFAVGILVLAPIWRLHTKLYKGAWNVSANNSETVGHKDLRLEQIVHILVFYNISFSWLLPPNGFQFNFSLRDSENDLYHIKIRNSGIVSKRKKNRFFFYIKPIATAKSAVGWQTLEYIYDILMTHGVKAKQDKKKLKIEQWWVFTRYASPLNWTLSLSKSADYEALETYTLDISCVEVSIELYCVLAYLPYRQKNFNDSTEDDLW